MRVVYDPQRSNPDRIRQAICEAYYDLQENTWFMPPFRIEDYDPLDLELDRENSSHGPKMKP